MKETPISPHISTKLARIAELAQEDPQRSFLSLAHHIDVEFLYEAYRRVRKDGAAGVDGQTASEFAKNLQGNLQALLDGLKSGSYRAPPVRRVHILKGDGKKTRPLGIPTFADKVLQMAVSMILTAIYEQDFLDCSHGFRPKRSALQALEKLRKGLMEIKGGWVLDADIQAYLETASYCTPFHGMKSNRFDFSSNTLIRNPLRLPRRRWTASSSPRFTRCNTV